MEKVTVCLVADIFSNFEERVNRFKYKDQSFLFVNITESTPAYWNKFEENTLVMIKK